MNKKAIDTSDDIRQIDVHRIDINQACHRYSTDLKLGLERTAADRKLKDGKNIISPPPTLCVLIITTDLPPFLNHAAPQILEKSVELHIWRIQLFDVDRFHRHTSMLFH